MNQPAVRVSVVDDEPVIAWTLAAILRCNGFDAESFTNPLHALESARTTPPDLLISDVVMPELSGLDLALRLKSIHPGCKVLLFSGQANTVEFLQQAGTLDQGFQILPKPIQPSDLLLAIREQWFPD